MFKDLLTPNRVPSKFYTRFLSKAVRRNRQKFRHPKFKKLRKKMFCLNCKVTWIWPSPCLVFSDFGGLSYFLDSIINLRFLWKGFVDYFHKVMFSNWSLKKKYHAIIFKLLLCQGVLSSDPLSRREMFDLLRYPEIRYFKSLSPRKTRSLRLLRPK